MAKSTKKPAAKRRLLVRDDRYYESVRKTTSEETSRAAEPERCHGFARPLKGVRVGPGRSVSEW